MILVRDARVSRWLTTDPYGEFSSPYLGMGNNPMLFVDLDGGQTGLSGARCGPGFFKRLWTSIKSTVFYMTHPGLRPKVATGPNGGGGGGIGFRHLSEWQYPLEGIRGMSFSDLNTYYKPDLINRGPTLFPIKKKKVENTDDQHGELEKGVDFFNSLRYDPDPKNAYDGFTPFSLLNVKKSNIVLSKLLNTLRSDGNLILHVSTTSFKSKTKELRVKSLVQFLRDNGIKNSVKHEFTKNTFSMFVEY